MKKKGIYFAIASLLLLSVSCKKEKEYVTLSDLQGKWQLKTKTTFYGINGEHPETENVDDESYYTFRESTFSFDVVNQGPDPSGNDTGTVELQHVYIGSASETHFIRFFRASNGDLIGLYKIIDFTVDNFKLRFVPPASTIVSYEYNLDKVE